MYREAFIGLGSNLGDRVAMLVAALRLLDADPAAHVLAVSRAYETEPWGVKDQPAFVNAVARIEYDGEADALLDLLRDIEARLGAGYYRLTGQWPPLLSGLSKILWFRQEAPGIFDRIRTDA